MEKREFPKIKEFPKMKDPADSGGGGSFMPKISNFSQKAFGITKLILGVCLLPFVYSATVSFLREFRLTESAAQDCFWAGVAAFIIIHLFIYELSVVYQKGHRLLEMIFKFFSPLVRVAPPLLPIYSIVIFIFYLLLSLIFKAKEFFYFFLFLFGFSLILHLTFSAKSIRSKQNDFLKANYIFGFSFIYITNILILALCLNLVFNKFSFVNFFNTSYQVAKDILYTVIKQLFLR